MWQSGSSLRWAVVVLIISNGNLNPAAVATELAAAILPVKRVTYAPFSGDAAPLTGTYRRP